MTRKKKPTNILFLQPQPCLRTLKYAKRLKKALGRGVHIVLGHLHYTLTELYGYGEDFFNELARLDVRNLNKDIKGLVKKFYPKIIHSHKAPDFITTSAIEAVDVSISANERVSSGTVFLRDWATNFHCTMVLKVGYSKRFSKWVQS